MSDVIDNIARMPLLPLPLPLPCRCRVPLPLPLPGPIAEVVVFEAEIHVEIRRRWPRPELPACHVRRPIAHVDIGASCR